MEIKLIDGIFITLSFSLFIIEMLIHDGVISSSMPDNELKYIGRISYALLMLVLIRVLIKIVEERDEGVLCTNMGARDEKGN